MRRLLDKLLNRFCVQTICIPNEGKWLLIIPSKVTPQNLALFRQSLEELRSQEDGSILIWYFGENARVKFIRIGK